MDIDASPPLYVDADEYPEGVEYEKAKQTYAKADKALSGSRPWFCKD